MVAEDVWFVETLYISGLEDPTYGRQVKMEDGTGDGVLFGSRTEAGLLGPNVKLKTFNSSLIKFLFKKILFSWFSIYLIYITKKLSNLINHEIQN